MTESGEYEHVASFTTAGKTMDEHTRQYGYAGLAYLLIYCTTVTVMAVLVATCFVYGTYAFGNEVLG